MDAFDERSQKLKPWVYAESPAAMSASSLISAAKAGHLSLVLFHMNSGASVEHEDNDGGTALMWAAINGHRFVLLHLLEHQAPAPVNQTNSMGETALMLAVQNRCTAIVDCLLYYGADPNCADEDGYTSLHYAALGGRADLVQKLLWAQADRDRLTADGDSALDLASTEEVRQLFLT